MIKSASAKALISLMLDGKNKSTSNSPSSMIFFNSRIDCFPETYSNVHHRKSLIAKEVKVLFHIISACIGLSKAVLKKFFPFLILSYKTHCQDTFPNWCFK
jgi:hypothetical protein